MTLRTRAAVAVAVALGLVLSGWLWFIRQPAAPAGVPAPVAAAPAYTAPKTAQTIRATPGSAATRPAAAEPPPLPPALKSARWLSEVHAELLQRAEGGDVAAMLELGYRLLPCSSNGMANQRRYLQSYQSYQRGNEDGPLSAAVQANVKKNIDTALRMLAECEGLPESQRGRGIDWMEQAAASGWGKAQLDYVEFALGEFRTLDENQAITQIEEFLRRRELAQRFLAEAMTRCVPLALNVQTFASDLLFDGGNARDYAINRAAAAVAAEREGMAAGADTLYLENRRSEFYSFVGELDDAARAEAHRRGEAMFNTCARR